VNKKKRWIGLWNDLNESKKNDEFNMIQQKKWK
jgi:hypothetical protein